MIKDILRGQLMTALESLGVAITAEELILEHPADLRFGDYSTNIALSLAKKQGKEPATLAAEIVSKLQAQSNENIDKVTVAGPGFINFYLTQKFFIGQVAEILNQKDNFGRGDTKNQKILVEYSSPNIAKPLHVGHLRSTIIGDAVANILQFSGYEVVRDNHLGDWGTQFGKQMVAIKKWGSEKELEESSDPLKILVSLYVRFHEEAAKDLTLEDEARQWSKRMEDKDPEAEHLWKKIIDWSMVEIKKVYALLDVRFDTYLGESFYLDKTKKVITILEKTDFYQKSDEAYLIFFPNDKYPPLMICKKDGSTVYATRDLATDLYRKETYGDNVTIINEVGGEQSLYLQQIFEAEKMLGWFKTGQRIHVSHGLYRFKEGKLSTRKGQVVWVEDILAEAIRRAGEFEPEVAKEVGIGALKYNDLKRDSRADILFDWDDILNLKGDSGPYLQYTYARTQSILDKAQTEKIQASVESSESPTPVEKLLYRFPEVVERAGQDHAPHQIATYIYELACAFSSYYTDHQIVSREAVSSYRVALTTAVGQVLQNGLHLLGIKTPSKM